MPHLTGRLGDSRYWALLFGRSSHLPVLSLPMSALPETKVCLYVSRMPGYAPDQNVTNDPTEGTPFESMTNSKYTPGGARLALAGAATVSVFPATVNESGRNR